MEETRYLSQWTMTVEIGQQRNKSLSPLEFSLFVKYSEGIKFLRANRLLLKFIKLFRRKLSLYKIHVDLLL